MRVGAVTPKIRPSFNGAPNKGVINCLNETAIKLDKIGKKHPLKIGIAIGLIVYGGFIAVGKLGMIAGAEHAKDKIAQASFEAGELTSEQQDNLKNLINYGKKRELLSCANSASDCVAETYSKIADAFKSGKTYEEVRKTLLNTIANNAKHKRGI